jgi:hypothetical protein
MKKTTTCLLSLIALIFFTIGTAYAVKPGVEGGINPNGFPSGPHYNLNIHGKKADFTASEQKYYFEITSGSLNDYAIGQLVETCPDGYECSLTTTPIYGNSIFVPENGIGIEIFMESGKVGGKGNKASVLPQNELWAIDPYAVFDGDGAVIQLPPGEYDVYARALAKPTDKPNLTVSPELISIEDEIGNDLLYLGLVTDNGFTTPSETFTRNKGKTKAVPITGLFEWTGDVCYFDDPGEGSVQSSKCCSDTDNDGVYDICDDSDQETCETSDFGEYVEVYCTEYNSEWIFNIGDFASYLWKTENNGLKLLQIRFYPR